MKIKISNLICINEDINLDNYISFRTLVKESMPFPEWLGDFRKEDLETIINSEGKYGYITMKKILLAQ